MNKRVLVIDDDEEIVSSLCWILEQRGYDVLIARDGAEGLMRAERDAPDLILLDAVMPRRSGFLVLDRLAFRKSGGPRIIMMTATVEARYRDFAMSRGVDEFVEKPFDVAQLMTKVEMLLET